MYRWKDPIIIIIIINIIIINFTIIIIRYLCIYL